MITLKSTKKGLGAAIEGETLVLKNAFSARYDLDVKTGKFLRPGLAEEDACVAGKVLVADRAKGGVASSWLLREMVRLGTAPAALVFNNAGPVMVQAAAFAGITLLDGFEEDVTEAIPNKLQVSVDPQEKTITPA